MAQRAEKKSTYAATTIAEGIGTTHHIYAKLFLAGIINSYAGGAVIAPWEVDGLPDDWLDAMTILTHKRKAKAQREQRNRGRV